MDLIDQANARAERDLELAIQAAREQAAMPSVRFEECLNGCGEPPADGSKWCCKDCRDEYDRRQQILCKQGVR